MIFFFYFLFFRFVPQGYVVSGPCWTGLVSQRKGKGVVKPVKHAHPDGVTVSTQHPGFPQGRCVQLSEDPVHQARTDEVSTFCLSFLSCVDLGQASKLPCLWRKLVLSPPHSTRNPR